MKKIKVSVIVPVYNMERHLRRCLDSLLAQSLDDIEIICVDDGSTDSSGEILSEYAQKDERFEFIAQENRSAGAARNTGMKKASGEYLIFLDSDDFFDKDLLKKTYEKAKQDNSDIVLFGGYEFDQTTGTVTAADYLLNTDFAPEGVFDSNRIPDSIYSISTPAAWLKLFRREFVFSLGIGFQELRNSNDVFFTSITLAMAERISILNEKLVYYRVGNAESTQAKKDSAPYCFLEAYSAIAAELKKREKLDLLKKSYIILLSSGIVYNLNSMKRPETRMSALKMIDGDPEMRSILMDMPDEDYLNQRNRWLIRYAICEYPRVDLLLNDHTIRKPRWYTRRVKRIYKSESAPGFADFLEAFICYEKLREEYEAAVRILKRRFKRASDFALLASKKVYSGLRDEQRWLMILLPDHLKNEAERVLY